MYYYLVDPLQFDGKNFEFYQTRLLSLLGEYNISGEVARVTKLRTVEDLVATAISHGVTTLVVVGGDDTFNRVISICHGKCLILGYIALNTAGELAKILGVENLSEAAAIIAKRRVENLDLAKIENTYFISSINFASISAYNSEKQGGGRDGWDGFSFLLKKLKISNLEETELVFNQNFRARGKFFAGSIINTRTHRSRNKDISLGNPKDGQLDVVLAGSLGWFQAWKCRKLVAERSYEALPGSSIVHSVKVEIRAPVGLPVFLSGRVVARAPATALITDEKLRVIVGRGRQF